MGLYIIEIALYLLPSLLRGEFVAENIPEGTTAKAAMVNLDRDTIAVQIEHPTFPPHSAGDLIPTLAVVGHKRNS